VGLVCAEAEREYARVWERCRSVVEGVYNVPASSSSSAMGGGAGGEGGSGVGVGAGAAGLEIEWSIEDVRAGFRR